MTSGRSTASSLAMFCSGFNHLAYHSLNKGDIRNDECRLCGEESEQAWHLAADCAATYWRRVEIFGEGGVGEKWTVDQLREFLSVPSVERIVTTRVNDEHGDPDWWTGGDG